MKALLWIRWNGRSNRVSKKKKQSLKFCGEDSCFSIHYGLWFYIYFYEIKSVVKTVIHIHMMCCFVFFNLFLCTFLQIKFFFPFDQIGLDPQFTKDSNFETQHNTFISHKASSPIFLINLLEHKI